MEHDELYSVKWYKGISEFYRYLPKDDPPSQVYEVHGVTVDLSLSSKDVVTLESVSLQSTGHYRCEVSAESPSFITVHSEGEMNVIALPSEGPKITGGKPKYQIGDMVLVNCTSYQSKPAAMLSWTINSDKAPKEYLKEYASIIQENGLETSILGLQFQVREGHFKDGEMKLRCTATIAPIYHQSNEESVVGGNQQASVLESKETPSQGKNPVTANRRNNGYSIHVSFWRTFWRTAVFALIVRFLER